MSMDTPHGWTSTMATSASGWQFINCWTPGQSPPFFAIPYSALPGQPGTVAYGPKEGDEFTVSNAYPDNAAFAAVISGGGLNHYKVRYSGANFSGGNWIRVG
jgi:hypothetical protein